MNSYLCTEFHLQKSRKDHPLTKISSCRRILTAWDDSRFCGRDALLATTLLLPPSRLSFVRYQTKNWQRLTLSFEVLSGITSEQTRDLIEKMNDQIVGVVVTPKLRHNGILGLP